jgi:hypothetical protein
MLRVSHITLAGLGFFLILVFSGLGQCAPADRTGIVGIKPLHDTSVMKFVGTWQSPELLVDIE